MPVAEDKTTLVADNYAYQALNLTKTETAQPENTPVKSLEDSNSLNSNTQNPVSTELVNQQTKTSNTAGKVGFALAIAALFFGHFPVFGEILWLIGFGFSLAGTIKTNNTLAIAGLVISIFVGIVLLSRFL